MKKYLFIIIGIIMLSSCSYRSLRYIKDPKEYAHGAEHEYVNTPPEYTLLPNDALYIKITTVNDEVNAIFNSNISTSYNTGTGNNQSADYYFTGYRVADSGYVSVPILGDFYVKDKTVKEVEEMIIEKVNEILIDAVVKVRLISFKVYFIGDINTEMFFYEDYINVLQVVAKIGGMSQGAAKRRILILRQTEKGYRTFRIDITKRSILELEDFYIFPNDIIYIEPLKTATLQMILSDYYMFFSLIGTVTTAVTTILLIKNLK